MKFWDDYNSVIAIGERSCGNDTIGDMWLETKLFDKTTPIEKIVEWAKSNCITGKLIITVTDPS